MTTDQDPGPAPALPDYVIRQALLVLFPLGEYRSLQMDDLLPKEQGQVRAVAELIHKYEVERRDLQKFRTMVVDLDRNEHGRHEGDVDGWEPSKGNPRLQTGDVLGYSLGGRWRYVMPEQGRRHQADARKVENSG